MYQSTWASTIGERLFTAPDPREEAVAYDKFVVGVYKDPTHDVLVGHIPIEISSLCYHFLNTNLDNTIIAEITGKRKREVGLVVPAKFVFKTYDMRCLEVLENELQKRKQLFPSVKLNFRKKGIYRKFPFYYK